MKLSKCAEFERCGVWGEVVESVVVGVRGSRSELMESRENSGAVGIKAKRWPEPPSACHVSGSGLTQTGVSDWCSGDES